MMLQNYGITTAHSKKNRAGIVLIYRPKYLLINVWNMARFLIMKISRLELHLRHEIFPVRSVGGQYALFEAAPAVVEVLYFDVGEDAHRAGREAGVEIGEENHVVSAKFRKLFPHPDHDVVKIGVHQLFKLGDAF